MATGSGKTITSMICATQLFENIGPLLIVVAAPYKPLIEQWCEEITPFGITPLNMTRAPGANGRARVLGTLRRRMRSGALDVAIVVVTHDTLTNKDFLQAIEGFECPKLLIADEVHNLGAPKFVNDPPMFFNYRLGLSATPVRQYDEDGTAFLLDYFGSVVFSYPLELAIGNCLVEYDYFVHPVELTLDEMDQWHSLTSKIKQRAWRQHDDKPDAGLQILLLKRRQVLENASSKIAILSQCLDQEDVRALDHTLMYTSDKNPKQLQEVNSLLNSRGILFHQLTDKETSNRAETKQILQSFQRGAIRILTAKRVLDEGVNIPEITKAYILASTTVERQWVQRRGRLLRRCEAINKTYSTIHDFAVVPPEGRDADSEARSVLKSELTRMQEFAKAGPECWSLRRTSSGHQRTCTHGLLRHIGGNMPANMRKVAGIILEETRSVEPRCAGYREHLTDIIVDIIDAERQNRVKRTNVQQQVSEKLNSGGLFLWRQSQNTDNN